MISVILLFILGLFLICFGGDKLVDSSVAVAKKIGIPQVGVGATIVGIGTTLPEILVSTTAAFDGSAAISAGNAFGSIICNTALIAGFGQLIPAVSGLIYFASRNHDLHFIRPRLDWKVLGDSCLNGSSEMVTNL